MLTKSNKTLGAALITGLALVIAGCGAVAHIEKDESVNFNNLHTYSWKSNVSLKAKNSNDLIDSKLKQTVSRELAASGWKEVKYHPDVYLDYDISVENTIKQRNDPVYSYPHARIYYNPFTRRLYRVYYPSRMLGYDSFDVPYTEGTITLNMTDRRTGKLIWQGWTKDEVNGKNLSAREIRNGVKPILKGLKSEN